MCFCEYFFSSFINTLIPYKIHTVNQMILLEKEKLLEKHSHRISQANEMITVYIYIFMIMRLCIIEWETLRRNSSCQWILQKRKMNRYIFIYIKWYTLLKKRMMKMNCIWTLNTFWYKTGNLLHKEKQIFFSIDLNSLREVLHCLFGWYTHKSPMFKHNASQI